MDSSAAERKKQDNRRMSNVDRENLEFALRLRATSKLEREFLANVKSWVEKYGIHQAHLTFEQRSWLADLGYLGRAVYGGRSE